MTFITKVDYLGLGKNIYYRFFVFRYDKDSSTLLHNSDSAKILSQIKQVLILFAFLSEFPVVGLHGKSSLDFKTLGSS